MKHNNRTLKHLFIGATMLTMGLTSCGSSASGENADDANQTSATASSDNNKSELNTTKNMTTIWISLTVSESKRLIAKSLLKYKPVADNLKDGQLLVTKGGTNQYVLEELLQKRLAPISFVNGRIEPTEGPKIPAPESVVSEKLFVNGQVVDATFDEALEQLKPGSIIFKGANMINYDKGEAVVLVGHPTGGTVGKITPYINDGKAKLIIPVGLEKNSSSDLSALAEEFKEKAQGRPRVMMIQGELFTEIEAIKQWADVEVKQIASGGINGAEGATSFVVVGAKAEVEKLQDVLKGIYGEKEYYRSEE